MRDADDLELDAYGHMAWTVGNDDWIACFDARRNGDRIEYHIVVNCESGGFVDMLEHDSVPIADGSAIADLKCLPDFWADICREHYADSRKRSDRVKVREVARCRKAWGQYLDGLIEAGPCSESDPCGVCTECCEPGPDPIRDGWVGSDGRP